MKNILLLFYSLFFISVVCAQDIQKSTGEEPAVITEYFGNGDVGNNSQIAFKQNESLVKQIKDLSSQLDQARDNGNVQMARELEGKINDLSGSKTASTDFGPQAVPLSDSFFPADEPTLINISVITPGLMYATATTTQATDGRIWVATTNFASGDTDTLRIFYSDDGGLSWSYLTGFTYGVTDLNFRADDLDIEAMYDGTDWYIYVSGSYLYAGAVTGFVVRYKDDGTGYYYVNLPKNSGNDQYWTRIVSDYPRYTSLAYLYIVATMDSLIDASTRKVVSRAFIIQNPYDASPTLVNRNGNTANGTGYWWNWSAAPNASTMKTDVAYYDSLGSGSTIVTCSIFENSKYDSLMYMTYSDNYMATEPYIANTFDLTYSSRRPIMSFNGGNDQLSGCITTMRNWMDGPDVDPRYAVTTDGGATWNQDYLEATTDTTVETDVIGLRGVDGHFKFGWINLNSPAADFWYRSGYLGASLTLSTPSMMNGGGIYPDDVFGGRAGYRLTATDSCFAVFEGGMGHGRNAYGVSGCSGAVSVEDETQVPENYSVSQNYPNPFNPNTTISFQIPQAGLVKIVVYNILGKEVALLLNEEKEAGKYEINFEAGNLSSGVYFYEVSSGNFTATRKMVLMK